MVFSQKYAIICPLEDIKEGQVFDASSWPLHVTLADTFAADTIGNDLILQLNSIAKGRDIHITGERAARFGKNKEVDVMLLEPSQDFYRLHSDIVTIPAQFIRYNQF